MTTTSPSPRSGHPVRRRLGASAQAALGLVMLAIFWEAYKRLGPEDGFAVGGVDVLPRTSDRSMPHLADVVARALEPVGNGSDSSPVWVVVLTAVMGTLLVAAVGFALAVVSAFVLSAIMQRFHMAESAIAPWLILSQTVPLIALAPVVVSWGGRIRIGPVEWQLWMSVALIAAFIALAPITLGLLRGLKAPDAIHVELMRTYNAGWWQTYVKLRLPASVPFLLPALRLGAAGAILGTVIAEVSTGRGGGIGRVVVEFARTASSDPAKSAAPVVAAIMLGLLVSGLVAILSSSLYRFGRQEAQ